MAEFLAAQPYIIRNEGGYVNDTSDSGGETYRGISRNNFPNWTGWATVDAHKPLQRNDIIKDPALDSSVNQFYCKQFWGALLADRVDSQEVATYLYDFYVNAGRNAVKTVQKLVGVTDDGVSGPATVAAINAHADLLPALHQARTAYYQRIGVGNNAKFLKGWINRANELYQSLS